MPAGKGGGRRIADRRARQGGRCGWTTTGYTTRRPCRHPGARRGYRRTAAPHPLAEAAAPPSTRRLKKGYAGCGADHVADYAQLFNRAGRASRLRQTGVPTRRAAAPCRPTSGVRRRRRRGRSAARGAAVPVRPLPADRAARGRGRSRRTSRGSGTTSSAPPWSSNYTININTRDELLARRDGKPAGVPRSRCSTSSRELAVNGRETVADQLRRWRLDGAPQHRSLAATRARRRFRRTAIRSGRTGRWPAPGCASTCGSTSLFGGDLGVSARQRLPVMKGAAEFCLDWLDRRRPGASGDRAVHVAGAQVHHARRARPRRQHGLDDGHRRFIWDLFTNCIEAAELLGIDADFRSRWRRRRATSSSR